MASVNFEDDDRSVTCSPVSLGIVPTAITKKPCEAISFKKLTCSQGESWHAPLPQTITGSLCWPSRSVIFSGLNKVCVGSVASVIMRALCTPVPPFSITLESTVSEKHGLIKKAANRKIKVLTVFMWDTLLITVVCFSAQTSAWRVQTHRHKGAEGPNSDCFGY